MFKFIKEQPSQLTKYFSGNFLGEKNLIEEELIENSQITYNFRIKEEVDILIKYLSNRDNEYSFKDKIFQQDKMKKHEAVNHLIDIMDENVTNEDKFSVLQAISATISEHSDSLKFKKSLKELMRHIISKSTTEHLIACLKSTVHNQKTSKNPDNSLPNNLFIQEKIFEAFFYRNEIRTLDLRLNYLSTKINELNDSLSFHPFEIFQWMLETINKSLLTKDQKKAYNELVRKHQFYLNEYISRIHALDSMYFSPI